MLLHGSPRFEVRRDVQHADADVVLVHLVDEHLHRVVEVGELRYVLEHVLRREDKLFLRLAVMDLREVLPVLLGCLAGRRGHADHEIYDTTFVRSAVRGSHESSLNTRTAFSRRNFGHTWSRNGTSGISLKMRSSDRPMG